MLAPRLQLDLGKIRHNARVLVERLAKRGICVTGVTKSVLGAPQIAAAMLQAGVHEVGDSRVENLEAMRRAPVLASMSLIRTPMISQAARVVASADLSFNSEIDVIRCLSVEARKQNRTHGVMLMLELGDLREGILPADLDAFVREIIPLPGIAIKGIGTNLACRNGVSPDQTNMGELSRLAIELEQTFDIRLQHVSGGNSANLEWAFNTESTGRINNLRLGESILLGREALHRHAIDGLHTDAITLVAEVIESKRKPTKPWGTFAQNVFGESVTVVDRGSVLQSILAIGSQDVEPGSLLAPQGVEIIGCSSDHLLVASSAGSAAVGTEVAFQLGYSALVRAMTSPFVAKSYRQSCDTTD